MCVQGVGNVDTLPNECPHIIITSITFATGSGHIATWLATLCPHVTRIALVNNTIQNRSVSCPHWSYNRSGGGLFAIRETSCLRHSAVTLSKRRHHRPFVATMVMCGEHKCLDVAIQRVARLLL